MPAPRPDPGTLDNGVPYGTRLARLTHAEYDQTLNDLLKTAGRHSDGFLEDPSFSGFDNSADGLRVSGRLGRDYRRAAEAAAAEVVSDPELLLSLSPCADASEECSAAFIRSIGLSAYRRPLSEVEVGRYQALFAEGPVLLATGDDFSDGAQLVLEAMLQSPHFLYRAELGTTEDEAGFIPLSSYEIASRLSYMLTGSMPDAELLAAADDDGLTDAAAISEHAERLTSSDALSRKVLDFHTQWLELRAFDNLSKDREQYPEFSPELALDYRAEVLHFVEDTLLERGRGLASLMSSNTAFVNQRTAGFYGLDENDFGPEYARVELGGNERAGLLTQLGFLTSHAYTHDTSPIHRGVFILRRILCEPIPDPPGGIDFTLPETDATIVTTRDQVEAHTSGPACTNCHSLINPIGFAFENYDALGRLRDTDNGAPVDTSGLVELSSGSLQFEDAIDLVHQLSKSEAARSCYANQWLRYAYARREVKADASTLAELSGRLADDTYSVRQLLMDLTKPRTFTHRAPTQRD